MVKQKTNTRLTKNRLHNILIWFHRIVNVILPSYTLKTLLLTSIHGVWMIFFSLFWLINVYYLDGFEFMNDIYDYKEFVQDYINPKEYKSNINEKYLLIDVSRNSQILPIGGLPIENEVIVDREQLCTTLNILDDNSDNIKYIICDVWLDISDESTDSSLQDVINRLNNKRKLVLATLVDDGDYSQQTPLAFKSETGVSQYKSSFLNTEFLKFSYYFKGFKQVPLIAYENITGDQIIEKSFLGVPYFKYKSGGICLNTIIPPFRYSSRDIIADETYISMGFFNISPESYIGNDQIVIIGDVTGGRGDMHHSIVDKISGPIILINALESLFHKDNKINAILLIMMFLFFLIISHHSFYAQKVKESVTEYGLKNRLLLMLLKNINYVSILILTIICMLVFNFYLNLFILLSYFAVLEFLIKTSQHFKRNKTKKT